MDERGAWRESGILQPSTLNRFTLHRSGEISVVAQSGRLSHRIAVWAEQTETLPKYRPPDLTRTLYVRKKASMMRLLRAALACLWNLGQRPSPAGGEPRLGWKGTRVIQACHYTPEGSRFDTLISTRLRRAGQRPGHTEQQGVS